MVGLAVISSELIGSKDFANFIFGFSALRVQVFINAMYAKLSDFALTQNLASKKKVRTSHRSSEPREPYIYTQGRGYNKKKRYCVV